MAKKKKYNAAGYNEYGVHQIIKDEERKRHGLASYKPWSNATKDKMVKACDGAKDMEAIVAVIAGLGGGHLSA